MHCFESGKYNIEESEKDDITYSSFVKVEKNGKKHVIYRERIPHKYTWDGVDNSQRLRNLIDIISNKSSGIVSHLIEHNYMARIVDIYICFSANKYSWVDGLNTKQSGAIPKLYVVQKFIPNSMNLSKFIKNKSPSPSQILSIKEKLRGFIEEILKKDYYLSFVDLFDFMVEINPKTQDIENIYLINPHRLKKNNDKIEKQNDLLKSIDNIISKEEKNVQNEKDNVVYMLMTKKKALHALQLETQKPEEKSLPKKEVKESEVEETPEKKVEATPEKVEATPEKKVEATPEKKSEAEISPIEEIVKKKPKQNRLSVSNTFKREIRHLQKDLDLLISKASKKKRQHSNKHSSKHKKRKSSKQKKKIKLSKNKK